MGRPNTQPHRRNILCEPQTDLPPKLLERKKLRIAKNRRVRLQISVLSAFQERFQAGAGELYMLELLREFHHPAHLP